MDFCGKVVIVTGASSGIGAAIAIKFTEQSAKVVIVARNEEKLKQVAEQCKKNGVEPLIITADLCKDSDIMKIINTTIQEYGKIDILINNAGVAGKTAIYKENAMQLYDRIMATNLRSAVYLTNLAAPHLIETRGNIINISSIASVNILSPGGFAYSTSKAGLDHFSRSAALDLGPKGVRVNTINPGPVKTDIVNFRSAADQVDIWERWAGSTVLGRVSLPEEIADLVMFIASDKARAITGSSIVTDNGVLLNRNIN